MKLVIVCMIILFLPSVVSFSVSSEGDDIPFWDSQWSYRQEIQIPIDTNESAAKFQPIDTHLTFEYPCWTKNVNETSIRVCYWDGTQWFELESQIYDLVREEDNLIAECNIVFLLPADTDGCERYYVYYDSSEKPRPIYTDHVSVTDEYYSYSPIADISATAQFYGIHEDGYCVYGVGQDGQLLDRGVAQVVVKQQNRSQKFDVLDSDQIVSFAFSYYYGSKEKDESSSDQTFISKKLFVDGNLMVEFGIISESKKKDVRTTAVYKYYYYPLDDKRISVHVKHQMFEDAMVQGIDNVDGRFGSIISLKSRSATIPQMNFGQIYPYLTFYGDKNTIEQYQMDQDPQTQNREWIISYQDDADLGKEAWLSYGEGREGKAYAVIFSSNSNIVKSGTDERDGIQLKVAEKEYFDFLGTQVDYVSINFARNSYESDSTHDVLIPSDLVVEFDAEVYSSETGGYPVVQREARLYQSLVKYRQLTQDPLFEQEKKRYDLTVITHFGGTRFSYPLLANRTGRHFPVMWIELYRDGQLIVSGAADRSMGIRASKTFTGVVEGTYLVKVYWKLSNSTKLFTGAATVDLYQKTKIQILCTWERKITAVFIDQNGQGLENVRVTILNKNGVVFAENNTDSTGTVLFKVPYNRKDSYVLQAMFNEFVLYNGTLQRSIRKLSVQIDTKLYDLTIEVKDLLNLPPGVEISPILSTSQYNKTILLSPERGDSGYFYFKNLLSGEYVLQILFADFIDERRIRIPDDGDTVNIQFTAQFDLTVDLYDSRGEPLQNEDCHVVILRGDEIVFESDDTTFILPPAQYRIEVYKDGEQIGIKEVELTNSRHMILVTKLTSLVPIIIIGLVVVFIGVLSVLFLLKKFSLSSYVKCIVFGVILIALMLPWWSLYGFSTTPAVERSVAMYMNPQVMIETAQYSNRTTYDIAEMPDVFVNMLGIIFLVAIGASVAFGVSVLLKKLRKKQYAFIASFLGVLFLLIVLTGFFLGMSKLAETSIGSVQGAGQLPFTIGKINVVLQATWGFNTGYYLIVFSSFLGAISLVYDIIRIIKKRKIS